MYNTTGINRRIDDAYFLWQNGRQESAFLLILVAIASLSKLRYPKLKDNDAFQKTIKDFCIGTSINVEYKGKLETIEHIFYKWVRCHLIHEGILPDDIVFQKDIEKNSMSIRAGGKPEFILKLGTGWFFHFLNSVKQSQEINETR